MQIEINDEMLDECIKSKMRSLYQDCCSRLENLSSTDATDTLPIPWFSFNYNEEFHRVAELKEAARIIHNYHCIVGVEEIEE